LAKLAKVLIMLVRVIAIVEIGLGVWIASAKGLPYLKVHIALGFVMALSVLLLALIAAVKRVFGLFVVGTAFAILIPVVGFKQFPLKFGPALGAPQYLHVLIVLAAIGIAEALHGKIKRTA
jgi:hypothetical protein